MLVISFRLNPILAPFFSEVTEILAFLRHIGLNLNMPLSRFKSLIGSIFYINFNTFEEKGYDACGQSAQHKSNVEIYKVSGNDKPWSIGISS